MSPDTHFLKQEEGRTPRFILAQPWQPTWYGGHRTGYIWMPEGWAVALRRIKASPAWTQAVATATSDRGGVQGSQPAIPKARRLAITPISGDLREPSPSQRSGFEAASLGGDFLGDPQATWFGWLWSAANIPEKDVPLAQ